MKTRLSYSTINNLYKIPHTWLCKQMGLKTKELEIFKEGKVIHKIIQNHVSGRTLDKRLKDLTLKFPEVETEDFDEKMRFEVDFDDNYSVIGFLDGKDVENGRMLEIKASGTLWTPKKFHDLMQWRVYGWALPEFKEVYLINAGRDLTNPLWGDSLRIFRKEITDDDRQKAYDWIKGGIEIIEKGDFQLDKEYTGYDTCLYEGCPYCK